MNILVNVLGVIDSGGVIAPRISLMLLLFKPWEYIKPEIWFYKTLLQIFQNIILSLMIFFSIVLYRSIGRHFFEYFGGYESE